MKQKVILLTFLGLSAFNENIQAQNVELEVNECNSFKTTHFLEKSEGSLYSVQLEKEIAPNLWALRSKISTELSYHIFTDLENGNYRATLVETNLAGDNEKIYQKISNDVNINCPVENRIESKIELFNIFPNPAKNELYVTSEFDFAIGSHFTYEIVNILGQKVKNGCIHSTKEKIELDNLELGTYVFIIKNNNNITSTKKLLINKKD
jgi:hypothetical protein